MSKDRMGPREERAEGINEAREIPIDRTDLIAVFESLKAASEDPENADVRFSFRVNEEGEAEVTLAKLKRRRTDWGSSDPLYESSLRVWSLFDPEGGETESGIEGSDGEQVNRFEAFDFQLWETNVLRTSMRHARSNAELDYFIDAFDEWSRETEQELGEKFFCIEDIVARGLELVEEGEDFREVLASLKECYEGHPDKDSFRVRTSKIFGYLLFGYKLVMRGEPFSRRLDRAILADAIIEAANNDLLDEETFWLEYCVTAGGAVQDERVARRCHEFLMSNEGMEMLTASEADMQHNVGLYIRRWLKGIGKDETRHIDNVEAISKGIHPKEREGAIQFGAILNLANDLTRRLHPQEATEYSSADINDYGFVGEAFYRVLEATRAIKSEDPEAWQRHQEQDRLHAEIISMIAEHIPGQQHARRQLTLKDVIDMYPEATDTQVAEIIRLLQEGKGLTQAYAHFYHSQKAGRRISGRRAKDPGGGIIS